LKKFILIDGNAIIHRAFHAVPPFRTSKGELTNAVYGFSSMLLNILNNEMPDYIAASFDLKGKTFRHEEYKEYKATRKKAPDELYAQIPRIKEVVRAFKIPIFEREGFEADDVLGTLAEMIKRDEEMNVYIVTGDRDAFQLIDKNVFVLTPIKGFSQSEIFDTDRVFEKYGVTPAQITDMKGLQGDSSDNIKGVAGVGAKTAKTLLQKYGNIEEIYKNLEEITGKVHENLKNDKESAFFSKKIATIVRDIPIDLNIESCRAYKYDKEGPAKLFEELEFKSLMQKLNRFNNHSDKKRTEDETKGKESQPSLF